MRRASASSRLGHFAKPEENRVENVSATSSPNILTMWLIRAGFSSPQAPVWFVLTTFLGLILGGTFVAFWMQLEYVQVTLLEQSFLGENIVPIIQPLIALAPWVFALTLTLLPFLYVRKCRRRRIAEIEQDLPLVLDLLATIVSSGGSLDSAISNLLSTPLGERPLLQELRKTQWEMLAGFSRLEVLRRLQQRIDIMSVSIWVSALIQADQLGMSLNNVLLQQATDLRSRRRERANAFTASLAVKLMLPMVACFLPSLFIWILGPVFWQFFEIADTILKTQGL
ncbi:MAG: type II secretion system F family protein [Pirellulaceae bacterium]|nr:type II secretion system F family protein [Pirellulaceae bacterium]